MADNSVSIRTICENLSVAISCLAGHPVSNGNSQQKPFELCITRLLYLAEHNLLFIKVPAQTIPARLTLIGAKEQAVIRGVVGFPVHIVTWEESIYFRFRCERTGTPSEERKEIQYEHT